MRSKWELSRDARAVQFQVRSNRTWARTCRHHRRVWSPKVHLLPPLGRNTRQLLLLLLAEQNAVKVRSWLRCTRALQPWSSGSVECRLLSTTAIGVMGLARAGAQRVSPSQARHGTPVCMSACDSSLPSGRVAVTSS
jgi:hypothetical protein